MKISALAKAGAKQLAELIGNIIRRGFSGGFRTDTLPLVTPPQVEGAFS